MTTAKRDANDILREEGVDALRQRGDEAAQRSKQQQNGADQRSFVNGPDARAALEREAAKVASARVHHIAALYTAAFSLGQLVADGLLDEGEVSGRLKDAAIANG